MKTKDMDVGNRYFGQHNMSSVEEIESLDRPPSDYIKGMSDYYYKHYVGKVFVIVYVAGFCVAYASFIYFCGCRCCWWCRCFFVDCAVTIVPYFDVSFVVALNDNVVVVDDEIGRAHVW